MASMTKIFPSQYNGFPFSLLAEHPKNHPAELNNPKSKTSLNKLREAPRITNYNS